MERYLIILIIFVLVHINSSFGGNWTKIAFGPGTKEFANSVVLANQRCQNNAPLVVVRPQETEDVRLAVKYARTNGLSVSVRAGGHGYTCSGVHRGTVLIDSRFLRQLDVDTDNLVLHVSPGLTWGEVLPTLRAKGLEVVHGQCTDVGVGGFILHGGVHFGAWSELYGLASDNIVGATVVLLGSGSVARISDHRCLLLHDAEGKANATKSKTTSIMDSDICRELMWALRGAGSITGVVTSLSIRVHPSPLGHQTALAVLSVDTADVSQAGTAISNFLTYDIPSTVSVTLFGVDAFFKAYMFVARFGLGSAPGVVFRRAKALFRRKRPSVKRLRGSSTLHFVVEVAWVEDKDKGTGVGIWECLRRVEHGLDGCTNANNDTGGSSSGTAKITVPFIPTERPWSVSSYDVVWGSGHYYFGASMAAPPRDTSTLLAAALHKFNAYSLSTSKQGSVASIPTCSDCVTVLHRVGDGIRTGGLSQSLPTSAVHPSRRNISLWVEVDCGVYHRHIERERVARWWRDGKKTFLTARSPSNINIQTPENGVLAQCRDFVTAVQTDMDNATTPGDRWHYPNVPHPSARFSLKQDIDVGNNDKSDGDSTHDGGAGTAEETFYSATGTARLRRLQRRLAQLAGVHSDLERPLPGESAVHETALPDYAHSTDTAQTVDMAQHTSARETTRAYRRRAWRDVRVLVGAVAIVVGAVRGLRSIPSKWD